MTTIRIIFIVFTIVLQTSITRAASDDCVANELILDSDVVRGQVILGRNGKDQPATNAEIEMFELRGNEWQRSGGKIRAVDKGYFTWLDVEPGKYMLIANLNGYAATKIYIHVKRRNGRERQIVIPLKAEGCVGARLRKK